MNSLCKMKDRLHENKPRNLPVTVTKVLALWKSKIILGHLTELANSSQNTLNLRNCRLMEMDLETERMFTQSHLYLTLKPSLKLEGFAQDRVRHTASFMHFHCHCLHYTSLTFFENNYYHIFARHTKLTRGHKITWASVKNKVSKILQENSILNEPVILRFAEVMRTVDNIFYIPTVPWTKAIYLLPSSIMNFHLYLCTKLRYPLHFHFMYYNVLQNLLFWWTNFIYKFLLAL